MTHYTHESWPTTHLQLYNISHPPGQEQLIACHGWLPEDCTEDVTAKLGLEVHFFFRVLFFFVPGGNEDIYLNTSWKCSRILLFRTPLGPKRIGG